MCVTPQSPRRLRTSEHQHGSSSMCIPHAMIGQLHFGGAVDDGSDVLEVSCWRRMVQGRGGPDLRRLELEEGAPEV
jgi:hypothetical protein